jgi:hypothetical protein
LAWSKTKKAEQKRLHSRHLTWRERELSQVWLPHRHRPAAVAPNSDEGGHSGCSASPAIGSWSTSTTAVRGHEPQPSLRTPKQGAPWWPPRPRHGHSGALRSGRSGHGTTSKTAYTSPMHLLTSRRPHNTDPHSHNGLAHRRA